ncbi:MAG: ABC transporter permease [Candidatus Diapherotrites archaeon]|uniref:ABC transporter permease n=1 Tax=Candidatus Iainarchaeum sp. TaxID=3101447 RepID=A0A939C6X9_9ARCH|nr:ABC transporter permease [Candidatus Diapherotrites archaeon]
MIDEELVSVAYRNLKMHKMRSLLTLLGIVIGIGAIVALVSIGEGLNQAITEQFEMLGLDTLFVEPGSGAGFSTAVSRTLKDSDIRLIEGIPGVEAAMGFYETAAIAEFRDKKASVLILGFDPNKREYLEKAGYLILSKGRNLESTDKYSILIPEGFSEDGFIEETLKIKDSLAINEQKFQIVGITEDLSSLMGGGLVSNFIFMPKETVQDFFGEEDPVEIAVQVTDRTLVDEVSEKIERRLKQAHGEEDFYIMTTENIMEAAGVVIGLVQVVLVGLAAISLLVGGIGIMNTMLMSVLERTREIGVMKAVGATNSRVLSIFLMEAGLIGAIGGVIGSAFGLLIAAGVSVVATAVGFPLPFGINPIVLAGATAFAMLVGMVAGYVPARRAAMLEPVEALRHGS